MGKFLEYCKIAYFNLKMNKVRAFLTMLGIIIGISSVVMIVSLGSGLSNSITSELDSAVGNYIEIMSMGEEGINQEDLEAIERLDSHIIGTSPISAFNAEATYDGKIDYSVMLTLGSEKLDEFQDLDLIRGRYFTKEEYLNKEQLIILTKGSARKIFGTDDVIGQSLDVTVFGSTFSYKIIGIRDDYSEQMGALNEYVNGSNYDLEAEIPILTFYEQTGLDGLEFYEVLLFLDDGQYASESSAHAKSILEARHDVRGENQFFVLNMKEILETISSIMNLVTVLVMLVAAISLFVGGIGVMNIMLVSVTERTREIGIRKALGARTGSILTQFLVESASISLCGGIIGTIIGLTGAEGVCLIINKLVEDMTIKADFNVLFIAGIALFSMSIGVVFGILPARKAAKLSPIEALRHR